MGHSNAREAASTAPVRALGWLHASNAWLVARLYKSKNCTTPLNTDSIDAEYRIHYSTKQYSTVVFSTV
jgi:hypothetical protein